MLVLNDSTIAVARTLMLYNAIGSWTKRTKLFPSQGREPEAPNNDQTRKKAKLKRIDFEKTDAMNQATKAHEITKFIPTSLLVQRNSSSVVSAAEHANHHLDNTP